MGKRTVTKVIMQTIESSGKVLNYDQLIELLPKNFIDRNHLYHVICRLRKSGKLVKVSRSEFISKQKVKNIGKKNESITDRVRKIFVMSPKSSITRKDLSRMLPDLKYDQIAGAIKELKNHSFIKTTGYGTYQVNMKHLTGLQVQVSPHVVKNNESEVRNLVEKFLRYIDHKIEKRAGEIAAHAISEYKRKAKEMVEML